MTWETPTQGKSSTEGWLLSIGLSILAFWAFLTVARTDDPLMGFHAAIFGGGFLLGIFFIVKTLFDKEEWLAKNSTEDAVSYNLSVVKAGVIAALFWGIAGFLIGDIVAFQLAFPDLNFDTSFINFGRLRPLHTSAVVFAFGGNVLIACSFYVVQRTSKARLPGQFAPWFVFWGYNLFVVVAGTGYLLGVTQGKEYAEPEWYADIWLTLVWVTYLLVYLGTLWKRQESHIYVANWFFLGFIVTIAMLHIVNNLAVPVSVFGTKSYVIFAGVQDALIQWWYGHNAVGFLLTAGFLGVMYYFVPKRAERPVYSYRLSIIHFWALTFMYIWAGPHHLFYTALPEWTQTLGMTFSVMLWMPSWAGMMNGMMTLSGAWDKLRTDAVLRFMVVALAFYGMSTFEGPLLSIKVVNSLSHYTDWTVGHVHSGAMGWVAFISFGALYCLVPWLWGRARLYSDQLVSLHFWISTLGILIYIVSMWVAGIIQGLMWRTYDEFGFLEYSFVESVQVMNLPYIARAVGGALFVIGALIMAYNVWRTIRGDVRDEKRQNAMIETPDPVAAS